MTDESDDDLVTRAKTDRDAMGRLYDRHYPPVYRYCARRLFVRETAEDIAADVFLQVAKSIGQFPGATSSDFRCWVFRIATNAINAQLRQTKRREELLRMAALSLRVRGSRALCCDDQLALDWPVVAEAILELDLAGQSVLTLRYVEGLSHDQIAAIVNKSPGAVRTILSRALGRLRARFVTDSDQSLEPRLTARPQKLL